MTSKHWHYCKCGASWVCHNEACTEDNECVQCAIEREERESDIAYAGEDGSE